MAIAQRILKMPAIVDRRSDRHLVRAAQKGDRAAASALIERYYPRIASFVSYMGANGYSEDLTQEVFARALTALPRFNGTYKVGPWLLRIARNLCIDESRRAHFRPEPVDPAALPEIERDDSSDNVWEAVSQHLTGSAVRHALGRLPARQRAALVLREIERLSYAEIAQVIGTNTRGAEATLRRARARFRVEVATADDVEADRATCQRILRQLAGSQATPIEVAKHLRRCPSCRSKAPKVKSADRLFGTLPPLVTGLSGARPGTRPGIWKDTLLSKLPPQSMQSRTLMELLRGRAELGLLSPVGQLAEIAASIAMAATVSVTSVAGIVHRVVVVAPSPPAVSPSGEAAEPAPSNPAEDIEAIAPVLEAAVPVLQPSQTAPEPVPALATADRAVTSAANLAARAGLAATSAVQPANGSVQEVSELAGGTSADLGTAPLPAPDVPVGNDVQTAASLPSTVSLPRRRPRPWPV